MKFWKFPGDSDEVPGHWKLPCARTEFCNKWIKLAEVVAWRDRLGVSCWIHLQGDGGVLRSLFYVPKEACECSIKAHTYYRFPRWLRDKESACNAGDLGSIPGSGRSSGGGHGNPLQYSNLENPMDRGAWQATVHGVTKNQIWLNNWALKHC